MTIIEATKACLRKYIVFSGRASRAEFWKFILGIFLASILVSIANVLVFGPVTETQFVIHTTPAGTTQGIHTSTRYGSGPFSTLLGLAVFFPVLAAATRRLHDIGRPGWHLVLPWAVATSMMAITLFAFQVQVNVLVSEEMQMAFPAIDETMAVPQPSLPLFLASWFADFATFILSIVWLARLGQPESNQYGPNPIAP